MSPTSGQGAVKRWRVLRLIALLLLWSAAVLFGFHRLVGYEVAPGASKPAPERAPEVAGLPLDSERPTLVLFAHPQCPCSRATFAELEKILTECPGRVATTVCFYTPSNEPVDWTQSKLWNRASSLPGVTVKADLDGHTAQALGAMTSGQVLLLDRSGAVLFSGGITGARGHEGDNPGHRAVVERILGRTRQRTSTPVFGCSLSDDDKPDARS